MKKQTVYETKHQGKIIRFDPERFAFVVPWLADEGTFGSCDDAKVAIDIRMRQEFETKRQRIEIPVLDHGGQPRTATGVHASNYNLLTSSGANKGGCWDRTFYPDTPVLRAAFAKRREHHLEADRYDALLQSFAIDSPSKPGRDSNITHAMVVNAWAQEAISTTDRAKKLTSLEAAMAKITRGEKRRIRL